MGHYNFEEQIVGRAGEIPSCMVLLDSKADTTRVNAREPMSSTHTSMQYLKGLKKSCHTRNVKPFITRDGF